MADYSALSETSVRLISENGLLVTHRRKLSSGQYDPETDSYSGSVVETVVPAVRATAGEKEHALYGFGIGSAMLYVAGAALADISTADDFDVEGVRFNALKIQRTAPAGTCLLWAVELQEVGPVPQTQEAGNG